MAAAEVLWSPQARKDLLDLYVVIGLESPAAAERYFERIEAKAVMLAEHPRLGVRRAEIRPSLRMLIEPPFLLLYKTEPDSDEGSIDSVEIVRVIDGRRDLTHLF